MDDSLHQALSVLTGGGVVAFPTETYYGLGVDPFNSYALNKLFDLKGRPHNKPILVLIHEIDQIYLLTNSIPEPYLPLMREFWPGPLTLIFKAVKHLHPLLTGSSDTVGIRMSPHPVAQDLCTKWKKPITATSANLTGMPPAKTSAEVINFFGSKIDCIIDGGSTPGGLCSTIVDCNEKGIVLVRKGQVDFGKISKVISAKG